MPTSATGRTTANGSPDGVLALGGKGRLAWAVALLLAALVLTRIEYRTRDPDSVLYAQIAARLSQEPLARWIAPDWPPGWYMRGLYREHPVGLFLPAALLARLGFPAEQAAYAVNSIYQVLALLLIQRLARAFVNPLEARPLGWLLQLLPIAFTYRIRANQEPAMLVCLLAALLGLERSRTRPHWGTLTALALMALTLVKGVLALPGFVLCVLWLWVRPPADRAGGHSKGKRAWAWLASAAVGSLATAAVYEGLYRNATGEGFLAVYLGRQLGAAAVAQSEALLAQKLYNVVWYLGRVLWFPFPWSIVILAAAWSATSRRFWPTAVAGPAAEFEPADGTDERSGGGATPQPPDARRAAMQHAPDDGRARGGVVFVAAVAAIYVALFSLSDRRADRYIFPVYYAVGACGAVLALRRWPRFRRAVEGADRQHPYMAVAVWVLAFALHLLAGRLHVPTIKLWAPDT